MQMQTNPGRKGIAGARTQNTLFEPDFLMLYKGEKYGQQNYYNVDMEVRRTSRRCAGSAVTTGCHLSMESL